MIFRQLTPSNDWTLGKGLSGYAANEQAIELNIKTRLQSWKGDWFAGLNDHVDWIGRLDKGQEANLNQEIQNVILASYGVVGITSFVGTLNRQTRAYQLTYDISTIFGQSFINQLELSAGLPVGS